MEDNKILIGLSIVSGITATLAWLSPKGAFHDAMKLGVITCLVVLVLAVLYTMPKRKNKEKN